MIPILYDKDETAFISNGIGRLRDCISCTCFEERNGVYEVDFEYPVNGLNFDKIQMGSIIMVAHDESGDIQPFDIVGYSRPIDGVVSFHAVHISYRQTTLTVAGTNKNSLEDAFDWLGTSSPRNPFSYWSDKESTGFLASADGVPHSVRSVLGGMEGSILDAYGGEYEWDKWNVKLWANRGTLKPFTIRYGVNLTDYSEEMDYSNTYNAVVPFWKGTDDKQNDIVVIGEMVSVETPSYTGRDYCIPLDVTDKFEAKPTKAQVESEGLSYMNVNQTYLPSQSTSVSFVRLDDSSNYSEIAKLQKCQLCDSINIVFPLYNMQGIFKIVRTEYDVLNERYLALELGTLSTSLADALGINQEASNKLITSNVADFVVDQGKTGMWTWRKWDSGIYECWGNKTASYSVNTSSTSYGGYRSGSLSIDAFPITLKEVPVITATVTSGSAGAWVNNIVATTSGGTFYLSCGSSLSASERTISFHVTGKWK